MVANLPLVINSVDKPNICMNIGVDDLSIINFVLTYLSNRVGRTTSGLINAKFCSAPAASKLPLLLNTASITAGLRHSTNAVSSSSVNLASSGMAVSHEFFGNLSLMKIILKVNMFDLVTGCMGRKSNSHSIALLFHSNKIYLWYQLLLDHLSSGLSIMFKFTAAS